MIKALAYFTLFLFMLVIPVSVCLMHSKKTQWFTRWKKWLWLSGAMVFSWGYANALTFGIYFLRDSGIPGPDFVFALFFGWLYLPIASIPILLIYFILRSVRQKGS